MDIKKLENWEKGFFGKKQTILERVAIYAIAPVVTIAIAGSIFGGGSYSDAAVMDRGEACLAEAANKASLSNLSEAQIRSGCRSIMRNAGLNKEQVQEVLDR